MRVIVCGGRGFRDRAAVYRTLSEWPESPDVPADLLESLREESELGHITIMHGAARGADTLAETVAGQLGFSTLIQPANWERHGRAAGPIRNQHMLEMGPCLVVAFPGGRGTADMVKRAKGAGVPVMEVPA